jgi:hypothetical protein
MLEDVVSCLQRLADVLQTERTLGVTLAGIGSGDQVGTGL